MELCLGNETKHQKINTLYTTYLVLSYVKSIRLCVLQA